MDIAAKRDDIGWLGYIIRLVSFVFKKEALLRDQRRKREEKDVKKSSFPLNPCVFPMSSSLCSFISNLAI
jgi:hypothetical protein